MVITYYAKLIKDHIFRGMVIDEQVSYLFDRRLLYEVRNRLWELVSRGLPTVVQQSVLVQIYLLRAPAMNFHVMHFIPQQMLYRACQPATNKPAGV